MTALRIALTADPELPVPPRLYGGIERIIHTLACGLSARGHEVTVFAHRESATAGRLVSWPGQNSRAHGDTLRNAASLAAEVMRGRFDLVHSFSRIAYLTPILPSRLPKIMTYQRAISARTVRWGHRLSRDTLSFTAISNWMMSDVAHIGRWDMIPNGVSLETYRFQRDVGASAPFVFLGRIEEIKGPHLAIQIAKRIGAPLVVAGNIPADKQDWFDAFIAPHIDGDQIRYLGPVDDAQKDYLLGNARALLMPILWDEPFGIVMAEAMACGTPVIGFARGAVPEVVVDGVTGFVRDTLDALVEVAARAGEIHRAACRKRVEETYSAEAVVDAYERLYLARMTESTSRQQVA
jgi:glycosyltransferase involved in cell wall biosynthesis